MNENLSAYSGEIFSDMAAKKGGILDAFYFSKKTQIYQIYFCVHFNEKSNSDAVASDILCGGTKKILKNGVIDDQGVTFPIILTLWDETEKIIYFGKRTVAGYEFSGHDEISAFRARFIGAFELKPGKYHAKVEMLKDVSEIDGRYCSLIFKAGHAD